MRSVFIGIGNSDNKLTQHQWAAFCADTYQLLRSFTADHRSDGGRFIGDWYSLTPSPYQSAAFAVQLPDDPGARLYEWLTGEVRKLAGRYGQDSIAWSLVQSTDFLPPPDEPIMEYLEGPDPR